ncbi:MAG TPA: uracil-DNA glycosylase, partial [Sphingobacteriaceae bacterium]|nr:uracil-DNA glycosylase [Sphingobacteriaceae bacterium]
MSIQIEESWKKVLEGEFEKGYMKALKKFLQDEKDSGHTIY